MATQTQSPEDKRLILYRLDQVEAAVKEVGIKVDRQDNIKKSDLIELRDTIVDRVTEIRADLQNQINKKADKDQVEDLRTLVKAVGGFLSSVIAALIIYYLTSRH